MTVITFRAPNDSNGNARVTLIAYDDGGVWRFHANGAYVGERAALKAIITAANIKDWAPFPVVVHVTNPERVRQLAQALDYQATDALIAALQEEAR